MDRSAIQEGSDVLFYSCSGFALGYLHALLSPLSAFSDLFCAPAHALVG
jgi:hypothetical protein